MTAKQIIAGLVLATTVSATSAYGFTFPGPTGPTSPSRTPTPGTPPPPPPAVPGNPPAPTAPPPAR